MLFWAPKCAEGPILDGPEDAQLRPHLPGRRLARLCGGLRPDLARGSCEARGDDGEEAGAATSVARRAMNWHLSHRFDRRALPLADRHYNRRKIGSPQFVPPGRCLVLLTEDAGALWVTSWPFGEYVRHRWPGAWVCSLFRRESGPRASELIREAVAATRSKYGDPPPLGLVSFINRKKVRPTIVRGSPVWGWTWLRAGFEPDGETAGGLLAFRLRPEAMPAAEPPLKGIAAEAA